MTLELVDDHRDAHQIDLTRAEPRVERSPVADLDLVIPVWNEEHRLPATLDQVIPYLGTRAWTTRLIVVDNGSVDATAEVVDRAESLGMGIEVIGCRTQGKGAAVRTGMAHSEAPWVGYFDADLSTPLETIDEAVHQLQRGFEVVIASRRCTGGRYVTDQPAARRLASRLFHAVTGSLVGTVTDTQCGFKCFDGPTARALFASCEVSGFAFDVEVVGRAHRAGLRMIELPVEWSHADGSTLHMGREGLRIAQEVWTLHRTLRGLEMSR